MMCDGVSRICVYSRISSQMFCVVIRKRGDGAQIRCVYQLGALQQWASWYCSTHSDAAEMHHTKLYPWSRANAIYSSREVGASSLLKFTRFLPLLVGSSVVGETGVPKYQTDVGRHLLQQYFPEKETRFMPIQHGQHLTDYLGRCAITQPVYIKWIVKEVGDSARSIPIQCSDDLVVHG
ncbi:hypothetical protein T02_13236 [Trichinella nativa]|uniref:Uncharacterized protein n=1 Tax=Trichinella nativa TaxID=6335 RepID=A0A0V1LGF4_9BILA|nr:hypothetical protein T02_13236 [Trichinella nativa]